MFQFQASMAVVVTGGMVSVVVWMVRENPVEVDTAPLSSVVTVVVGHATSSEVVYGSKEMVVVVERVSGGKMILQGGMQAIEGQS